MIAYALAKNVPIPDRGVFSESAPLERVLLAVPEATFDDPELCEYFGCRSLLDVSAIRREIDQLARSYRSFGVEVVFLNDLLNIEERDLLRALPNSYFLRDNAAALGSTIFVGSQSYSSRSAEFPLLADALERLPQQTTVVRPDFSDTTMSGEFGDFVCAAPGKLLINVGNRTLLPYVRSIAPRLFNEGFESITLVQLPRLLRFAHLDLACNVLPGGRGLLASDHFRHFVVQELSSSGKSQYLPFQSWAARHSLPVVYISSAEQEQGVTNYIFIDEKNILCGVRHSRLEAIAAEFNATVHLTPSDAIFAGGGRVRCATLILARQR